jgi:hypothetical protein
MERDLVPAFQRTLPMAPFWPECSLAYTGTDLLIKHVGNLQLYRIDLVAHTKTAEGDLLPAGASYFTLLPSRLRMVLGVGGGLNVKAYQQVGGHWTSWPTFLQVN